MNEIVIYQSTDNDVQIEVQFENETVWLNQYQLARLFDGSCSNIVEHIKNIYKTKELDEKTTCRNFRQVRKEGKRMVERDIEHYNLDVIISLGYRVNSKQGIQFRQWATQRLKGHLVQGYTVNQKRLDELQQMVQLITQKAENPLNIEEAKGLLDIIGQYTKSFVQLNQYDSNTIAPQKLNEHITYGVGYCEAKEAIAELKRQLIAKKEATELFANEKDKSCEGTLRSVMQAHTGHYAAYRQSIINSRR